MAENASMQLENPVYVVDVWVAKQSCCYQKQCTLLVALLLRQPNNEHGRHSRMISAKKNIEKKKVAKDEPMNL